jgi:excisionase family DNA binding protein
VAYRPREVAEMVGMSESGVRNLIKRGTLRAIQLDGRWLIPAAVIEDKLGVSLDARPAPEAASIRPSDQPSPGGDLDVA